VVFRDVIFVPSDSLSFSFCSDTFVEKGNANEMLFGKYHGTRKFGREERSWIDGIQIILENRLRGCELY
jgi:hypothetical protein